MSGIAGLRGTGNWGTDERPTNFREGILFYNPEGTAPIFALTSKAGKKTVDDPQFSWWSESNNIVRLQINGAMASGDTTATVDTPDPTTTTASVPYGTATHLKPGDILLVEPLTDNATFNHELLEVDTVLSDTQFNVRRGAGGTTPASIADNQFLTLIGSAYSEGTDAPPAVTRNPLKFTNFTQIFKDSYELTGTADETATRTGSAWSNDKKRKMFDHSRAIEESMLWGRAAETTGDNGKPKRFMGGLRSIIPTSRTTVFGAPVTVNSFLDALQPSYDFDTEGGNTRLAFAGNQAIIELNKILIATTNVRVNWEKKIDLFGMDFVEMIMPRGRVLFKSHPLLSQHGLYKKSMFVIDFASLKYVCLRNRDTKVKDDVQTKSEDVRRGFIQTECSLMVDRGGLTMAYLGNISAT